MLEKKKTATKKTTQKKSSSTKSIRSSSHRNEDKSKRNFEEIIDPWYVNWNSRDYGVDGMIEISSRILNSNDSANENKYFLVQLKSIERVTVKGGLMSFPIDVKKIRQWQVANVPVLFVVNNLEKNVFFCQWVDDFLIDELDKRNPDWLFQKEITLKMSVENNLSKEHRERIYEYILKWKAPARKLIEPGNFFILKDKVADFITLYQNISKDFKFPSINESVNVLRSRIDEAIYKIAITGPSRAGKSSLINKLLRKQVSPVGLSQTTAVTIQILPSSKDEIKILFKNGSVTPYNFSFDIINQYASQEQNEDNKKGVNVIYINLSNRYLERGVSFYDIPGLDDPDDHIRNHTWQTLARSNAVIYLIDGSPAENGSFIFRNEFKEQLKELSSQDKIFLVFNKIDTLSESSFRRLNDDVVKALKKFNLYDKISAKIFYISTLGNKKNPNCQTVEELEHEIWQYILKENKYGLYRLSLINKDIFKSMDCFCDILRVRLIDSEKRNKLEQAMAKVRKKIPDLSRQYKNKQFEMKESLSQFCENRMNNILIDFEDQLKKFDKNKDLPNSDVIKKFLANGINKTLESANNQYAKHIHLLKEDIDKWIEENLKDVREAISGKAQTKFIEFTEVENFIAPEIDYGSAIGMGFLGILGGAFINPLAAIAAGFLGFFGNLITSAESRRAKEIMKIMEKARSAYNKSFHKIEEGYSDLIKESGARIAAYVNSKINLYFDDINSQLSLMENPISKAESKIYKDAFSRIEDLKNNLKKFDEELREYSTAI